MIEAIFLIISILLSCTSSFVLGYLFHEREIASSTDGYIKEEEPMRNIPLSIRETTGGVGIVYRPSAQELNKMNEDQATREAKDAIAETLSKEKEPTI